MFGLFVKKTEIRELQDKVNGLLAGLTLVTAAPNIDTDDLMKVWTHICYAPAKHIPPYVTELFRAFDIDNADVEEVCEFLRLIPREGLSYEAFALLRILDIYVKQKVQPDA